MSSLSAERNRRILVVDDNSAIHDDFRKILSPAQATSGTLDATEEALFGTAPEAPDRARFEVDSADQGQQGVLLVKKALESGRPYAMAFVDVRMPPGLDGMETSRKMWDLDPDIQIVLCTAYSDYSWDEMFRKLGQRDGLLILKKPFDSVEAIQMAHALTEKWWLHQQSKRKMHDLESTVAARTAELRFANEELQTEVRGHEITVSTLRESEEKFRQLADNITDAFWIRSADMRELLYLSPGFERIWGRAVESLYSGPHAWTEFVVPEDRDRVTASYATLTEDAASISLEFRITRPSGETRWVHARGFQVRDSESRVVRLAGVVTDITERKRLEAQLLESQKMESVGKLAGGIAHEFNSILTAIIGQSELLATDLPAGSVPAKSAVEIGRAAQRAAGLTRQLLAFGRKQFLQSRTLDLNVVIAGMSGLFQNLPGGDVDTRIVPDPDLGSVRADAAQIEQVIMNLAINAREAMPNGGKLTLETANVSIDAESVGRFSDLTPGDYVMLAITDTGAGMSAAVKARVFEPFFSTKGIGQGTGLGLSTCYGIIKQSGGHILAYSEVGRGTTFKIYLPRVEHEATVHGPHLEAPDLPRGTETILLVEDDPALREMASSLLKRLGYSVVAAADGIEALGLEQERERGPIDLLFTDVAMPHMSGKELAERVQSRDPNTRVLFTSAYTENAMIHQALLSRGMPLLQKPFTPSALAHKLREVLDQPGSLEAARFRLQEAT